MFNETLTAIAAASEKELAPIFAEVDRVAQKNTERVLAAFREECVSDSLFGGTTGYGYDDRGREVLEKVYARVFGAEAALVRHSIANGTHALAIGLFGILRPGDVMLSVTSRPYDTLSEAIGIDRKNGDGSLADFGVDYDQVDFTEDGKIDFDGIDAKLKEHGDRVKMVFIQRSKGYLNRPTLTVAQIGEIASFVHARSKAFVVVDNCYGEFTEDKEPTEVGADLIIGSLIKNPGGGLALSGGYLAGTQRAVELASYRYTCAGIGGEVGSTLGQNRNMFQGFFMAPHTVAQAVKTAHFAAYVFDKLGFEVMPHWSERRSDIIQTVQLGSADGLVGFCRGIQAGSPVDAFVAPEPWAMPGYNDPVVMAAGTFVQGASIELSADGPIRPPYTAFFQGGLTYESGRYGVLMAAEKVLEKN
ncbi:MAG: methionine gamma-lyase family protein [Clostridia bacterium]|nr:methionine gamma-lyase family protein [Clostridia bacterium]